MSTQTLTVSPIYICYKDGTQTLWIRRPTKIFTDGHDKAVIIKSGTPLKLIEGKWVYTPQ
ncbi:MAG: hypothetical protein WC365_08120 [Candidatus Babeliales bacterium]